MGWITLLWTIEYQKRMIAPTAMENNGLQRNNLNHGLLENTPFYRCIRPLLLFQKIGGGWIHRPLRSPNEKYHYYAFKIYCIFWELITIGVLIRTVFIFNKNVSIDIENLITIMQGSTMICLAIGQFSSFFKYRQVLPFWYGMIHMYPQRFYNRLNWSRFTILTMVIISLCILATSVGSGIYLVLKPEHEAAYIKLTEPWSGNIAEARVAYVLTVICFLPSYITWMGAGLQFMVAAYYLRCGFRDLYILISDDTQLVNQLALHKTVHLRLSQLTVDLDDILWGYTGASMAMCMFNMCFVIFAFHESHRSSEIMGSASLFLMALATMGIIVVYSISINTWVSWCTLVDRRYHTESWGQDY